VTNVPEPFAENTNQILSFEGEKKRENVRVVALCTLHWRSIALMYYLLHHYHSAALPCDLQFQGRLWKQANNFYCEAFEHRQIFLSSRVIQIGCENGDYEAH
jgi:hypothetical protein